MRIPLALLAVSAILIACSSDNSTGPDPRNCTAGTIGDNETKTGHIGNESCRVYDWAYLADSTYSVSYDVQLEQGKGYVFNLQRDTVTKNWDAVLELVGRDANTGDEQLLQLSDDEGPMNFSQMHFIAQESGTYSLRVMAYDTTEKANYVLQSRRCDSPRAPITDTLLPSDFSLGLSDCVLEQPDFTGSEADSTYFQMFTVTIGPNETKTITVSSDAFNPGFQIFGPGWGVDCGYGYEGCGGDVQSNDPEEGSSTVATTLTANGQNCCSEVHLNYPGTYTMTLGGSTFGDMGLYTVQVQNGATIPSDVSPSRNPFAATISPSLRFLTKKPTHKHPSLHRVSTRH